MTENNTDIFGRSFGDGSNRWIPGIQETVQNPVERIQNPYDTVAGAADAAALNFDEGVGGLVSLIDDEPENTAGPGQQNVFDQDITEGGALFAGIGGIVILVGLLYLLRPIAEIGANVTE
jgi:hypothetical protein